nr:metallothiol transferase FosB [Tanacetum cinerariifolium]
FVPIRRPGSFDFDGAWLFNYVEKKLKEMGITYKRQRVEEGGIYVDQLFFHDPDGFMIEICNCDNLPVIPLAGEMVRSCSRLNFDIISQKQIQTFVQL